MIRQARTADEGAILEMAERFYAVTGYAERVGPYCAATMLQRIRELTGQHVLMVAEEGDQLVGMLGAYVVPFLFNASKTGAYEACWWVNPEARGGMLAVRLLKAAEEAAKAKGADHIDMIHLATSPPQAAAIYGRTGYAPSQTTWTKEI